MAAGMQSLAGKNAIVTGASRGIGVYIARALAAQGMNLVLSARSRGPIEQLAKELSQQGVRALAVAADVAVAADRETLLQLAEAEFGAIDVLINNAALETNAAYTTFSAAEIEQLIHVDLIAPMLLTRALLPAMLQRKSGHIVNIASLAGKSATPYNVPYSAAKGGLILFTHSLRSELVGSGVRASVIVPGFIAETGMYAEKERDHAADVPAIVGTSKPEAVARAVIDVLRSGRVEIIVAPGPMRLSQAFNQLFPAAFAWFVKRIGAMEPFRRVAAQTRRDQ
jgi:short-subunit dehydrogenase